LSFARASENVKRKSDHVHVCLTHDVQFHKLTTGFERYVFTYEALPEINLDDVDTSTNLFGKRLSMPLMISPITGGTEEGGELNRRLASAAQKFGIAMGVGSQRVALEDPSLEDTFRVRDVAPDILLFANLGAVQLNNGHGIESCMRAVKMIDADVLTLHINPLQESVQRHGNTNFRDLSKRIKAVCEAVDIPVMVKEVGHGMSAHTAELLVEAGVAGIDVAGAGGTSWAKVECFRDADPALVAIGGTLGEWGIPTAESLIDVRRVAPGAVVIASGGIRSGEDVAKSVALGANAAGIALPLLKAAAESEQALHDSLIQLRRELAAVMFCTSSRTPSDLPYPTQL
jgi:isopentenyl-diphosphate delta-isomerase